MVYLVIGGICCAWALLRIIGGERQHRLNRLKIEQMLAGVKKPADAANSVR